MIIFLVSTNKIEMFVMFVVVLSKYFLTELFILLESNYLVIKIIESNGLIRFD